MQITLSLDEHDNGGDDDDDDDGNAGRILSLENWLTEQRGDSRTDSARERKANTLDSRVELS